MVSISCFFGPGSPDEDDSEDDDNISKPHSYLRMLSDLGVIYVVNGLSTGGMGFHDF